MCKTLSCFIFVSSFPLISVRLHGTKHNENKKLFTALVNKIVFLSFLSLACLYPCFMFISPLYLFYFALRARKRFFHLVASLSTTTDHCEQIDFHFALNLFTWMKISFFVFRFWFDNECWFLIVTVKEKKKIKKFRRDFVYLLISIERQIFAM